MRRLVELAIGADNPDDVDRVASQVTALGVDVKRTEDGMTATDPGTGVRVRVEVAPRLQPGAGRRRRRTTAPAASTAWAARRSCHRTTSP